MPQMRLDEARKEILHVRLRQRGRQPGSCFCSKTPRRLRAQLWVSLRMPRKLLPSLAALLLLAACATTSKVERDVDLGSGFHQVTMTEPSHSSSAGTGHFDYLYFNNQRICQLGTCSISPSGKFAIYQDGPSGGLFLFKPGEGLPIQLVQDVAAAVDSFEWHEAARYVVVRFANGVRPQTFSLL